MLDLNRSVMRAKEANTVINAAIDAALTDRMGREPRRGYLGASSIGHECLRRIQWDWQEPGEVEARTARIFARGHWWEGYSAELMVRAGFDLRRNIPDLAFEQADGRFRGHGDGKFFDGPELPGGGYPCLWEHKALGATGWRKLEREGLNKAYPHYADQVALYQAYLGLAEHPAIFTAANADTAELLHLLVPFDAARAQAASDRAVTVLLAVENGEVLPRISDDPKDWRCKMCPLKARCWG